MTPYIATLNKDNDSVIAYSANEADFNLFNINLPIGVSKISLECTVEFSIFRTCGHTFATTCSKAYFKSYTLCRELVPIQCPKSDCNHVRNVECYLYSAENRSGKTFICQQPVQKICEKCGLNRVEVACCKSAVDCHSEVAAKLECGHEISWMCGSDEDPRIKTGDCQACIYPVWMSLINQKIELDEDRVLINELLVKIQNLLECFEINDVNNVEENKLKSNLVNHAKCREVIVARYLQNAQNTGTKISLPNNKKLCDHSLYKLVFAEVKNEKDRTCFEFEQEATSYGRGYQINELSRDALSRCESDANGNIHIIVGIAFGFKPSSVQPPFCASLNKKG